MRHHKFCFLIFQAEDDKIILTWGPSGDLDLRLAIIDVCEVLPWKNCTGAFSDGDVTSGYGPETITIENYYDKTYGVYIVCFSGNCANTGGKLDIMPKGYDTITINVPTDYDGNYWLIGCFNGSEGLNNIKIANVLSQLSDYPSCDNNWSYCEEICNSY